MRSGLSRAVTKAVLGNPFQVFPTYPPPKNTTPERSISVKGRMENRWNKGAPTIKGAQKGEKKGKGGKPAISKGKSQNTAPPGSTYIGRNYDPNYKGGKGKKKGMQKD